MDPMLIPAAAAFGGSTSGALAAVVIGWVTQRRKDQTRSSSRRQKLYKSFIEEASRLYADALTNDKAEISQLVGMYALVGRMKIISSDEVNEAAEKAAQSIIRAYFSPNRTLVDLPLLLDEIDPLRDFSEACRRELKG
jgi:type II secretory pathway pseudopilin PulG